LRVAPEYLDGEGLRVPEPARPRKCHHQLRDDGIPVRRERAQQIAGAFQELDGDRRRARCRFERGPTQPPRGLGVGCFGTQGQVVSHNQGADACGRQRPANLAVELAAHVEGNVLVDRVSYQVVPERQALVALTDDPSGDGLLQWRG
jgi:hypothetical protein